MQQINFYLSLRRPSRYAINFSRFCKIFAGLLILIFGTSIIQKSLLVYDNYRLNDLSAEQNRIRQESQKLIESSANVKAAIKLKQNITDLTTIITQARLLQQTINKNSPYNISPYLVALAKASMPGLWITQISIKDRGSRIFLKGSVLDPILMPKFIKALEQQEVFSKIPLINLKITHQPQVAYADFLLSTP